MHIIKIGRGTIMREVVVVSCGEEQNIITFLPHQALGSPQESSASQCTRNQCIGEDRTCLLLAKVSSLHWLWGSRDVYVGEKAPSKLCLELDKFAVPESPFTGKQVLKRL